MKESARNLLTKILNKLDRKQLKTSMYTFIPSTIAVAVLTIFTSIYIVSIFAIILVLLKNGSDILYDAHLSDYQSFEITESQKKIFIYDMSVTVITLVILSPLFLIF